MTLWPRLHGKAARELRAAVGWYEKRQPGLGRRFYERVEVVLMRVAMASCLACG